MSNATDSNHSIKEFSCNPCPTNISSQTVVRLRRPTQCGIRSYRVLRNATKAGSLSCAKFLESSQHGELEPISVASCEPDTIKHDAVKETSERNSTTTEADDQDDEDDGFVNIESINPVVEHQAEVAETADLAMEALDEVELAQEAKPLSMEKISKPQPPPRPPPPQPRRPNSLVGDEQVDQQQPTAIPPCRSQLFAKRYTSPSIQPLNLNQQHQHPQPPQCQLWDLRDDSLTCRRLSRPITLTAANTGLLFSGSDKSDNFSRSFSSSTSSLEHCNKEAIVLLQFAAAHLKKTDNQSTPTLWIGTSHGSIFPMRIQLPLTEAARANQPAVAAPSGTVIRMLGAIQDVSFLTVAPPTADDTQLVSLCSDKQVRVISLPSLTCCAKKKLTETSNVAKASVSLIRGHACLVCLLANGHIVVNSLPGLKPLLDVDYSPCVDVRFSRTFQCSNHGHAVYFCSPSEVQKITICSDVCNDLNDMLADLYTPCDLPEPPKKSLLEKFGQNLFGSGSAAPVDREQIFGEAAAGKPMSGICTVKQGPQNMEALRARAGGASSEIANALQKGLERGEKLGELDDQTERMRNAALEYRNVAGQLAQKYKDKDKKFWQF